MADIDLIATRFNQIKYFIKCHYCNLVNESVASFSHMTTPKQKSKDSSGTNTVTFNLALKNCLFAAIDMFR